jgi:dihydroflavonol-4-reductase
VKPILITGATGFLGQYVVELLRGRPLRLLARGKTRWDADASIEVVRGDVINASDVERAVAGASQVYHLAGLVSRDPAMAAEMHRVHVDSTKLICEAALRHGVERVVLASSSGTIAVSKDPVEHTEAAPYPLDIISKWPYYLSKVHAEQLALECFRRDKLPLVIINPALLLGPGDERGSSTGDVKAFLEGQIMTVPPGGMNFVDARDAAAGTVAAMERGRPGDRYLLGGTNWTFGRLTKEASLISRVRAPVLPSPTWLSLACAPALRALMPMLGRKFTMDRESIEMSGYFWYCDSSKAKRELGFTVRDPLLTMRETIEFIRAHS